MKVIISFPHSEAKSIRAMEAASVAKLKRLWRFNRAENHGFHGCEDGISRFLFELDNAARAIRGAQ